MKTGDIVLEGCEKLCLTGDLITCPLTLVGQRECKSRQQYRAGQEESRRETWDTAIHTAVQEARLEGIKEVMEPSNELLEIGRKAIEDELVEWRDNRLSMFTRGNGLVIREKDGTESSMIRFGPETALRIGLKAMGKTKLKE